MTTAPPRFGAHWRAQQGRTDFALWAPSADAVELELLGQGRIAMQRDDAGWFTVTAAAMPGSAYRYRLADDQCVPDPASRAQQGDVDGASLVVDADAYDWQCRDWRGRPWGESIVYEMHVGRFGGFAAAARELPRLAALGITIVELMPVAEFAGARNWGYDGVLPFAPEASYGSPDELKAFVDAAHGLGLSVWLDVVYNHFGPEGNHLGAYAQSFFHTEQSSAWGASIDFSRREVRQFFTANAMQWLGEYRFDGLRLDAVHAIGDDGFLRELARTLREAFEPERHIHLVLENERNEAALLADGHYDGQWNDDFHNALHVLLTGEQESYYGNYAASPLRHLLRVLSEGFAYQGEPMPAQGGAPRGTPSGELAPTAFVNFLQNHDQVGNRAKGERLTTLVAPEALRAAQALLLLSPGIPLLFMGEEWDSTSPFLFFTDFDEPLAEAVRQGRRQEFAGFAAFADAEARNSIPDPNAMETFERSKPAATEPAASARIAGLLALRHAELIPRLPGARALAADQVGPAALVARWRLGDGAVLRIACNLAPEPVRLPPLESARLLHESVDGAAGHWQRGLLPALTTVVEIEAAP